MNQETVTRLFTDVQPGPEEADIKPAFIEMARAVANIAATRMLLLIAVLTGAAIWVFTIYDPSRDRLFAAVAYSLVFVLPQTALYYRRG
jgi:hypothetical protein